MIYELKSLESDIGALLQRYYFQRLEGWPIERYIDHNLESIDVLNKVDSLYFANNIDIIYIRQHVVNEIKNRMLIELIKEIKKTVNEAR